MPVIYTDSVCTKQPQYPVAVDASVLVALLPMGTQFGLCLPMMLPGTNPYSGVSCYIGSSSFGSFFGTVGAPHDSVRAVTPFFYSLARVSTTYITAFTVLDVVANTNVFSDNPSGGTITISINTNKEVLFNTTVIGVVEVGTHAISIEVSSPTNVTTRVATVYCDGELLSSISYDSFSNKYNIGSRNYNSTGHSDSTVMVHMVSVVLGTGKGKTLSENPWQIFKPRNRILYFPVSSGSAWTLIVANALQSHTLESVALTQANIITLNNAAQAQSVDAANLSQTSVLTVNSTQATHTVDAAVLSQGQIITLNHANHSHTLESVALTQAQRLALFDAAHLQSVDSIILVGDGSLALDNSIQAQSVNEIALNQSSLLSLFGAAHSQLADTSQLTQQHFINTASSAQAQTNDAVELSTIPTLSAGNAIQSQAVDALTLIQAHLLAVSVALHSQTVTPIVLNQETTLATDSTAHTQTASSLELTQIIVLAVLNALHDQSSDLLSLATHVTLIIDDALHAQLATAAIESAITPAGRVFMVAGESSLYLVAAAATRSFKI